MVPTSKTIRNGIRTLAGRPPADVDADKFDALTAKADE
jgi:hypothetical protein